MIIANNFTNLLWRCSYVGYVLVSEWITLNILVFPLINMGDNYESNRSGFIVKKDK